MVTLTRTGWPTAVRRSGAGSVRHRSERYDDDRTTHPVEAVSLASPQNSVTCILAASVLKPRPSICSSAPPPGVPITAVAASRSAVCSGCTRATDVTSSPARIWPGFAKPAEETYSSASASPASHSGMRQRKVSAS